MIRYLVPVVLLVVVAAKAGEIARPAWRLVIDGARDEPFGAILAVVLLACFAGIGWFVRGRRSEPPSRR